MDGGQERGEKGAQKIRDTFLEAEDLPEIEARGGEQGVATVVGAALQPVAAEQSVVFGVTDDRFDDRAALQAAFDLVSDAAFLARDVHCGVGMTGETVPLVSLIDRSAQRTAAHHIPHIVESNLQRVAVVRIAVQRPRLQDEVPALGRMQIGGDGNFATEFVRGPRFAFADAFHFRRVPGIEIALVTALLMRDVPSTA
jgi:hypothetical protein